MRGCCAGSGVEIRSGPGGGSGAAVSWAMRRECVKVKGLDGLELSSALLSLGLDVLGGRAGRSVKVRRGAEEEISSVQ